MGTAGQWILKNYDIISKIIIRLIISIASIKLSFSLFEKINIFIGKKTYQIAEKKLEYDPLELGVL